MRNARAPHASSSSRRVTRTRRTARRCLLIAGWSEPRSAGYRPRRPGHAAPYGRALTAYAAPRAPLRASHPPRSWGSGGAALSSAQAARWGLRATPNVTPPQPRP
jgi:hypothetical protein